VLRWQTPLFTQAGLDGVHDKDAWATIKDRALSLSERAFSQLGTAAIEQSHRILVKADRIRVVHGAQAVDALRDGDKPGQDGAALAHLDGWVDGCVERPQRRKRASERERVACRPAGASGDRKVAPRKRLDLLRT
jgi:hypothetical protein